jgi:hypothetical protein
MSEKRLEGKPEGERSLGNRDRREDNIITDLKEMGRKGVDCIHLFQVRDQWRAFVNSVVARSADFIFQEGLRSVELVS